MRISFIGHTNGSYPYINTIAMEVNGKEIVLDRDETEYTINNDGTLNCLFKGVYVWDGETENYQVVPETFEGAKLISVDIDNDAPEGYVLTIDPESLRFS